MASSTQWTWVWVNSRSWWWTGRPDVLRFMGSQRVGHDWATELNWTGTISLASLGLQPQTADHVIFLSLHSHITPLSRQTTDNLLLGLFSWRTWVTQRIRATRLFQESELRPESSEHKARTSLMLLWMRICLPKGTWAPPLAREDSICWAATKPMSHT